MTTPPPDKQPAAETLEETALRIASVPYPSYSQLSKRRKHADAILSALRNERERCAKITDDILPIGSDDCYWCERVKRAAISIKEGK